MKDIEALAPYPNCSFKYCDLRGQCLGEGKCHHPANELTKPQEAVAEVHQNTASQIFLRNLDGSSFNMAKFIGHKLYLAPPNYEALVKENERLREALKLLKDATCISERADDFGQLQKWVNAVCTKALEGR